MAGNHQVLVGLYHIGSDPAAGGGDPPLVLAVCCLVQLEPEPVTGPTDSAPHRRRILSDTGGEDDPAEAAERSRKRSNVAGNAIAKQLDGKAGTRIITGQELAEIRRNTGKAEHARAFVEELDQLFRRHPLLLNEV